MDDCKSILKELKVDWDETLDSSFNPLKMALKLSSNSNLYMNFKETFHRLESSLEKVISSNFQSFNESSLSFDTFKNKNKEIIEIYDSLEIALDSLKIKDQGSLSESVVPELQETQAKYRICASITEAKNLYKAFQASDDPHRKSTVLMKALEILSDQKLSTIKGVSEYYKMVLKSHSQFSNQVNGKLLDFIIRNNTENLVYFEILISLQTVTAFDKFCCDNFSNELFRYVEEIILEHTKYQPLQILDRLCKSIIECIETVISNMEVIIKKVTSLFVRTDKRDFFGKKESDIRFIFDLEECLRCVREVLGRFISRYSFESQNDCDFDIESVPDSLDYSTIYDKDSPIFNSILQRIENSKVDDDSTDFMKTEFTLLVPVNPEMILILLRCVKNKEIKAFLHQTIESRFYSDVSVQSKIKQIENVVNCIDQGNINDNIGDDLLKVLEGCISVEEEHRVKTHLRSRLFFSLIGLFNKVFVSKLIKNEKYFLLNEIKNNFSYNNNNDDASNDNNNTPKAKSKDKIDSGNNSKSKTRSKDKGKIISSNSRNNSKSKINSSKDTLKINDNDTNNISDNDTNNVSDNDTNNVSNNNNYNMNNNALDALNLNKILVSMDSFKNLLIKESIRKTDVFQKQQYSTIKSLLKSLEKLNVQSDDINFLVNLFESALKRKIILDFFYYFDLLYRQGNYSYYMKMCCDVVETGLDCEIEFNKDLEECLERYCRENMPYIKVSSRSDLSRLLNILQIFSEIFGENVDISNILSFFRAVDEGSSNDKYGKMLISKIS